MTVTTEKKIIEELKAENKESNKKIIAFYEKKIKEVYILAIKKAFNQ